jgi:hypothetical protein
MSLGYGLTQIGQRDDRVYLTSDKELARAYAGMWTRQGGGMGGGSLYKVATDDPLDPDADLLSLPDISFQVASARVVEVYNAYVPCDRRKFERLFRRLLAELERAKEH